MAQPSSTDIESPRLASAPAVPAAPSVASQPFLRVPEIGRLVLVLVDVGLIGLALYLGYVLRFEFELGAIESYGKVPAIEYLKVFVIFAPAIMVLCHGWGLFRLHSLRSTIEETTIIAKAVTMATALVLVLTFFYRGLNRYEEFNYSRLVFAYFWLLCTVFITVAHVGFRSWQLRRYKRGLDRRRTVFVGRNLSYLAQQLASESSFGLQVIGYIDPNGAGVDAPDAAVNAEHATRVGALVRSAGTREHVTELPRLGKVAEIEELLDRHPVEELIVVDQDLTHQALLNTIDVCEARGVKVQMVPAIYDLLVGPEDFTYVQSVPLIRVDERRYHRLTRFAKRGFDVVISGGLLLTLWPLLLLIGAVIRATSNGPALFIQTRAGENGVPFRMFKFRTMVHGAEKRLDEVVDLDALEQPVFKVPGDPRITAFGRILRRTSMDELPQLWNVLKGDMSLVGPRPEELRVAARYDVWQRRRLKIKPGITGLQQVEARGALSSLDDRVRLDVYYIRKQSLLLDLAILLRTVWAVIRGTGAS